MLKKALIRLPKARYLSLLIVIAPFLNFLTGTDVNLFSPSMPAMAHYFAVSDLLIKNLITIGLVGFAMACLVTGLLMDLFGTKRVTVVGLICFVLASLAIPLASNITGLLVARFFQGFFIASASVGARALVMDNFSGEKYTTGILYVSLTYSMGIIAGPFLGGLLQDTLGWQACFYTYAILGALLVTLLLLFVTENHRCAASRQLSSAFKTYARIGCCAAFVCGASLAGLQVVEQSLYSLVGPFIVQHQLGFSAFGFGTSALFLGLVYLIGVLLNRNFMRKYSLTYLQQRGLIGAVFAALIQICSSIIFGLNLWTLLIPLLLMNIALGFVYANNAALVLRIFPDNSGLASAMFIFVSLIVSSLALFLISTWHIDSAKAVGFIVLVAACLQLCLFTRVKKAESA